jgi:hypothetical protein
MRSASARQTTRRTFSHQAEDDQVRPLSSCRSQRPVTAVSYNYLVSVLPQVVFKQIGDRLLVVHDEHLLGVFHLS